MKSYYHILFLLPTLTLIPISIASAQDAKNEVEKSIGRDEMPPSSLLMLNQFWNEEKKADFYRQSDGEMISYEAKLVMKRHQYSIEFDSSGSLTDIEQLIKFEELSKAMQNTITEEIDEQYNRFRITRIQRQFSASEEGDDDDVLENVLNEDFEDLIIRYEIEMDAQNKDELGSFELLFDEHGNYIQKRRIVRRSLDNIW